MQQQQQQNAQYQNYAANAQNNVAAVNQAPN